MRTLFFEELVKNNGDKIVHYTNTENGKKYVSVFNYSEMYGGTINSFKYYNDYVIELGEKTKEEILNV